MLKATALIVAGAALTIIAARHRTVAQPRWGERLCGTMVMIDGGATWLDGVTLAGAEWMHWVAVAVGCVGAGLIIGGCVARHQ